MGVNERGGILVINRTDAGKKSERECFVVKLAFRAGLKSVDAVKTIPVKIVAGEAEQADAGARQNRCPAPP